MKSDSRFWTAVLCALGTASAEMPMDDNLTISSVGASYTYELNGFTMNEGRESISSMMHLGGLHYAPIPYMMLTAKFGAGRSVVNSSGLTFISDNGFAAQGTISLYTPEFAQILRVTLAGNGVSCRTNFADGQFVSRFIRPSLGLIISPLPITDFELGARYCWQTGKSDLDRLSVSEITNDDRMMGYLQCTVHSPESGAFLLLNGELSANPSSDDEGIYSSAVGLSVGTVLRHNKRSKFSRE